VRIEGPVVPSSASESDAYFASRPWQSRIGAWASQQSTSVPSRAALAAAVDRAARRFGVPSPMQSADDCADPGIPIPRPPHWGGYQLWAEAVELWVDGAARLHDRARWTRILEPSATGFTAGSWSAMRLQP
jgi:pyridoxamine 5'-phosphate oxidase